MRTTAEATLSRPGQASEADQLQSPPSNARGDVVVATEGTTQERLSVPRDSLVSAHLDFVRAGAAIAVFLGHARNLFFVDYSELADPGIVTRAWYFATGLGHSWVMVFFVLSGLFVGGSIRNDLERGRWSWRRYAVNRLTRLYVVLIPALVLTWLLDGLGMWLTGSAIYTGGGPHQLFKDVRDSLNATTFAGNLLFLQTLYVPVFGSNGPLWSLSNEFWYYLAFPLAVLTFNHRSRAPRMATAGAFLLTMLVSWALVPHFVIWLMGARIAYSTRWAALERPRARNCILTVYGGLLIASLCLVRMRFIGSSYAADLLVGAAFSLLVYALLHAPFTQANKSYERATAAAAGMSYTLYLVHVPLLTFIAALLGLEKRWLPVGSNVLAFALVVAVVFALAGLCASLTERHTNAARGLVERVLSRAASRHRRADPLP